MAYKYLTLACVKKHEKKAAERGVSKVARSKKGFLTAFKKADGDPDKLPSSWKKKRDAFIKRHKAQVNKRGEPLRKSGSPTNRHLAFIMWAYSPEKGCPRP